MNRLKMLLFAPVILLLNKDYKRFMVSSVLWMATAGLSNIYYAIAHSEDTDEWIERKQAYSTWRESLLINLAISQEKREESLKLRKSKASKRSSDLSIQRTIDKQKRKEAAALRKKTSLALKEEKQRKKREALLESQRLERLEVERRAQAARDRQFRLDEVSRPYKFIEINYHTLAVDKTNDHYFRCFTNNLERCLLGETDLTPKRGKVSDILNIDIVVRSKTFQSSIHSKSKTSTASMAGRGLVGAALFGPLGAVVGANTAAKKKTTSTATSIDYNTYIVYMYLANAKPIQLMTTKSQVEANNLVLQLSHYLNT